MHNPGARGPTVIQGSDFPGGGARTWRPRPILLLVGAAAALAAACWAVLAAEPLDRLVAIVLIVVLAAATVTAWRRRLVAGPRGLLISGIAGTRIVAWSEVRSLDRVTSSRFGLSTTTIEVDMVDDELLVFGRTDLGADPDEVLAVLRGWFSP